MRIGHVLRKSGTTSKGVAGGGAADGDAAGRCPGTAGSWPAARSATSWCRCDSGHQLLGGRRHAALEPLGKDAGRWRECGGGLAPGLADGSWHALGHVPCRPVGTSRTAPAVPACRQGAAGGRSDARRRLRCAARRRPRPSAGRPARCGCLARGCRSQQPTAWTGPRRWFPRSWLRCGAFPASARALPARRPPRCRQPSPARTRRAWTPCVVRRGSRAVRPRAAGSRRRPVPRAWPAGWPAEGWRPATCAARRSASRARTRRPAARWLALLQVDDETVAGMAQACQVALFQGQALALPADHGAPLHAGADRRL